MSPKEYLDDSELRRLGVDISEAPYRVQRGARQTVQKGAVIVRDAMRTDASGHRHLSHLPTAVSYSMIRELEAEIGLAPKRGTQGSLAHIIAFGSVNNAPVYDHTAGLRRSEPRILELFAGMAEESVLGRTGIDRR